MSWTMRIARGASAHSSRRVIADISGDAPPAVAPPPRPGRLGLLFGAHALGGRLDVMAVAFGEQLLLARARASATMSSNVSICSAARRRPPRSPPCPRPRPRRPAGGGPVKSGTTSAAPSPRRKDIGWIGISSPDLGGGYQPGYRVMLRCVTPLRNAFECKNSYLLTSLRSTERAELPQCHYLTRCRGGFHHAKTSHESHAYSRRRGSRPRIFDDAACPRPCARRSGARGTVVGLVHA